MLFHIVVEHNPFEELPEQRLRVVLFHIVVEHKEVNDSRGRV